MIIHILKQIWAQRKSNIWIFIELSLIGIFLWFVVDKAIVDIYTYTRPTGFDYSHIYKIKLSKLQECLPGYISQEELAETDAADLLQLINQIRTIPEIENVAGSFYSMFYSNGNSSSQVARDTSDLAQAKFYQLRRVIPEFFQLFRIKSEQGEDILPSVLHPASVVLTKELKDILFKNESPIGREVLIGNEGQSSYTVAAITTPIRSTEYEKAVPNIFVCLEGPVLTDIIKDFDVTRFELLIRISPNADKDYLSTFTSKMGERTRVNNLYISGIEPLSKVRSEKVEPYRKEQKTQLILVSFVLLNIFLGIIATFWLRTGHRRGEIGLRMALGASSWNMFRYLFLEGLCLLMLTLIPVVLVTLNLAFAEFIDIERLPFTVWRFLAGIGITYLLMFAMIALGIWYPARRSAQTQPAEALHYE